MRLNRKKLLELYLEKVDKAYEDTDNFHSKANDLIIFLREYSERRDMKLEDYFPELFMEWFTVLKKRESNE